MTAKEFLDLLERQPQQNLIEFNFCRCVPTTFNSSRGDYSQLALGWSATWNEVRVGQVVEELKMAISGTFQGYKGGTYRMNPGVEVWIDNWGEWTEAEIKGVVQSNHGFEDTPGTTLIIANRRDLP